MGGSKCQMDGLVLNSLKYIIFHYWNNEKATPHKIICNPRLVGKQDIPEGFLLRMEKNADKFLLIEYDINKSIDLDKFDISKVQRKGKDRYIPFVTSFEDILLRYYSTGNQGS